MSDAPFKLFSTSLGRKLSCYLFLVFLGSVLLDQVSKWEVQDKLLINEFDKDDIRTFQGDRYVIGSIGDRSKDAGAPFYIGLKFQYSRNPGAAFSMFSSWPDNIRVPFFYAVTVIAIVMIGYLLSSLPYNQHCTRVGLIFIAAGAVGNFLDRLHYGYVVDFIDFDWNFFGWYHDFAIFNVADMSINIGIYLYIIDFFISRKREKKLLASQGA